MKGHWSKGLISCLGVCACRSGGHRSKAIKANGRETHSSGWIGERSFPTTRAPGNAFAGRGGFRLVNRCLCRVSRIPSLVGHRGDSPTSIAHSPTAGNLGISDRHCRPRPPRRCIVQVPPSQRGPEVQYVEDLLHGGQKQPPVQGQEPHVVVRVCTAVSDVRPDGAFASGNQRSSYILAAARAIAR